MTDNGYMSKLSGRQSFAGMVLASLVHWLVLDLSFGLYVTIEMAGGENYGNIVLFMAPFLLLIAVIHSLILRRSIRGKDLWWRSFLERGGTAALIVSVPVGLLVLLVLPFMYPVFFVFLWFSGVAGMASGVVLWHYLQCCLGGADLEGEVREG